MREFLKSNGPWGQLVEFGDIELMPLEADEPVQLNGRIKVTPMLVPHRDEYSETVGFRIDRPSQSVLFMPDIDKWERWDRRIEDVLAGVDVAFVDGSFYDADEIPGRDMSEMPHPFIAESMTRLEPLPASERQKVRFIHLNHTNPALRPESDARRAIEAAGFGVAEERQRTNL
jgi:pyrroloquinoline quinone biosynthesis protein B